MKNILVIFIVLLSSSTSFAFETLNNGVGLVDKAVENQLYNTSIPYAIARQGQRSINNRSIKAYIDLGASVYSISSGLDLIETRSSDRSVLGHWPLSRWTKEAIEQEVLNRYELVNRAYYKPYTLYRDAPLACLNSSPLRYGDIDGDSNNELVLFIGNDLIIFSTEHQRIVFAVNVRVDDWFNEEGTALYFKYNTYEASREDKPQYQSAANGDYPEATPGYRGYAKLFIGDYDEDGNPDILIWRKLYLSNLVNNPQTGFTKQKDSLYHYERDLSAQAKLPAGVTGEYLPQTTDTATIQTWLSDNNLTWQKGYPSLSECAGQAGQLNPEMHDPLLNDPEVLK